MRLLSTFVALACLLRRLGREIGATIPGAAAGVKHAQAGDNTILLSVLGLGAVAFIAFVVSNGGSTTLSPVVNQSSTTTTTS